MELLLSAQSPSRNKNYTSTRKNLLKNRNWTFPVVQHFTWVCVQNFAKDCSKFPIYFVYGCSSNIVANIGKPKSVTSMYFTGEVWLFKTTFFDNLLINFFWNDSYLKLNNLLVARDLLQIAQCSVVVVKLFGTNWKNRYVLVVKVVYCEMLSGLVGYGT